MQKEEPEKNKESQMKSNAEEWKHGPHPQLLLFPLEDHIEDDDPSVKRDAVRCYTRPAYAEFEKEELIAQEEFRQELWEVGDDFESLNYDEAQQGLMKHDQRTGEKMIGDVYIPAREMCSQFQTNQTCQSGSYCPLRHSYEHEPLENPGLVRPEGDTTGLGEAAYDEQAD